MDKLRPCPLCGKDGIPHARRQHLAHCSDIKCFMYYVAIPVNEWQKRPVEDALLEACKAALEDKSQLEKIYRTEADGRLLEKLRAAIEKAEVAYERR